jgi:hypothetical protein
MAYDPETKEWALGDTETEAKNALRVLLVGKAIAEEEWPDYDEPTADE